MSDSSHAKYATIVTGSGLYDDLGAQIKDHLDFHAKIDAESFMVATGRRSFLVIVRGSESPWDDTTQCVASFAFVGDTSFQVAKMKSLWANGVNRDEVYEELDKWYADTCSRTRAVCRQRNQPWVRNTTSASFNPFAGICQRFSEKISDSDPNGEVIKDGLKRISEKGVKQYTPEVINTVLDHLAALSSTYCDTLSKMCLMELSHLSAYIDFNVVSIGNTVGSA